MADRQDRERLRCSRRRALGALAVLPWTATLPGWFAAGCAHSPGEAASRTLRAGVGMQRLLADTEALTEIWAYAGAAPGPLLRYRQGETVDIELENYLPQATTIHWHGIRLPNAMDGVPFLTQPPVASGGTFRYRFPVPDAGTYWYHPHARSHEQVTRGLYGALIVDEPAPPDVDEDALWVLADWLLDRSGAQRTDFEDPRDMSHAGRIGNVVTLNGRFSMHLEADPAPWRVTAGSRLRLRLLNAASARMFELRFDGAVPLVIAYDGQPVEPHPPTETSLTLGPAMRVDLMLDVPAGRVRISDVADRRRPYVVRDIIGAGTSARRSAFRGLPSNPLPEPDPARAERHTVVLDGGARSRMRSARVHGKEVPINALVRDYGMAWAMNGVAANDHHHEPLFSVQRGTHCIVSIDNRTEWHHPMHLHGHAFRVLSINGVASRLREWRDTLTLDPNGRAEIAFVADNPGDWMFHCHILQHQQGGMMATIRVT